LLATYPSGFTDVQYAYAEDVTAASSDVPEGVIMDGLTAEDEKKIDSTKESFVFQAEVNRLMDIIINSLCKSIAHTIYCSYPCRDIPVLHYCRQEQGGFPA
jgi:hypothetical protein